MQSYLLNPMTDQYDIHSTILFVAIVKARKAWYPFSPHENDVIGKGSEQKVNMFFNQAYDQHLVCMVVVSS